jgi:hypothetical protein
MQAMGPPYIAAVVFKVSTARTVNFFMTWFSFHRFHRKMAAQIFKEVGRAANVQLAYCDPEPWLHYSGRPQIRY